MIQFNLLPDVKKEYIRIKRMKRLIISISSTVSISVFVILFLLFSFVQFGQKKSINDLSKDIDIEIAKVTSVEGVNEILTIQNQLNALPEIHKNRPETSRLFEYMKTITPKGVFVSSLEIDLLSSTIDISGTADTLALINTYADTLKFATFTVKDVGDESDETLQDNKDRPFSEVITNLNRNEETSSYNIILKFNPIIFDNTKIVRLLIPNTVSTRSVTGQPSIDSSVDDETLFNAPPEIETVEE